MFAVGGAVTIQRVDQLTGKLDTTPIVGIEDAVIAGRQHLAVVVLGTVVKGCLLPIWPDLLPVTAGIKPSGAACQAAKPSKTKEYTVG